MSGGADRGVWEVAVAARRSGVRGEGVYPETGRLTSAETLRPPGLHVGETSLLEPRGVGGTLKVAGWLPPQGG